MAEPETVYILLVEVGRTADDGLPQGATGAALMCYSSGRTERHAVDETVKVLREAGMAPLEVQSYGTREKPEIELGPEELALMDRALAENAVIVASVTALDEKTALEDDDD
ncbi:MAG TPA: hypothetical protein VLA52_10365 [Thermohalobaculum sp.]|nr:hypothetical protein [Thermohalobaculum sp.]